MLNGIDISAHQRGIDLTIVPCDFVIIKVTEGLSYINTDWQRAYEQGKALGKKLGLYHFADGESSGMSEADYFLDNISGCIGEAVLVLDWEADAIHSGTEYAKEFLDRVYQRTSVKPLIYMSGSVSNEWDWSSVASAGYPLWSAYYSNGYASMGYDQNAPVYGTPYWDVLINQYTSTGDLSGYDGNLDLNVFYSTYEGWDTLAGGGTGILPQPPTAQPESTYLWDLLAIQYWMVICNYNPFAPIDGIDGEQTEAGVKTGQRGYGVEADGKFGLITQRRAEGQVLAYQTKLKELGYYTGELDGIPGRLTFQAVMNFQSANGLVEDGIVGEQTFNALMGSPVPPIFPDQTDETMLSKNFKRSEFKCECGVLGLHYCDGYPVEPNPVLIRVLQRLSDEIGKPIFITSGIRCQSYNDSLVGSIPNSIHLSGGAADFTFDGIDTWWIVEWCDAQPEVTYSYTNDSYMYGAVHVQVE